MDMLLENTSRILVLNMDLAEIEREREDSTFGNKI